MGEGHMKDNVNGDFPFDLELLIAANGKSMQHFYTMPPEKRQELLDSASKTNRMINNKATD